MTLDTWGTYVNYYILKRNKQIGCFVSTLAFLIYSKNENKNISQSLLVNAKSYGNFVAQSYEFNYLRTTLFLQHLATFRRSFKIEYVTGTYEVTPRPRPLNEFLQLQQLPSPHWYWKHDAETAK